MRSFQVVIALALGVACIGTPGSAAAQRAPAIRVRLGVPGHLHPVALDSLASTTELAVPRGKAFVALEQMFAQLKIPVDVRDSLSGTIGNTRIIRMRNFAGSPMSRFLNCGFGLTGQHADNWRIYVSVFGFADAKGSDSTYLRLALVAGAQDIEGASKDPVACGSTGIFESMVAERVKNLLLLR